MPVGVGLLDEGDFRIAVPVLQRLLALDGRYNRVGLLVPDQTVHSMLGCETGDGIGLVFVYSPSKVFCHADVECAILVAS